MSLTRTRLALLGLGVLAAAAALTVLLASGASTVGSGGKEPRKRADAPANGIWEVGTTWTVRVPKDNSVVAPDGEHAGRYVATYRFRVEQRDGRTWSVRAMLDQAEGLFADGYRLVYAERDGAMVLRKVGIGKDRLAGAEHAGILLGADFPLERRYTSPPKNRTVKITTASTGEPGLPPALPKSGPPSGTPAPPGIGAPPTGASPARVV